MKDSAVYLRSEQGMILPRIGGGNQGRIPSGLRPLPTPLAGDASRSHGLRPRAPSDATQRSQHLGTKVGFEGRSIAPAVSLPAALVAGDLVQGRRSCRGAKVGRIWVGVAAF